MSPHRHLLDSVQATDHELVRASRERMVDSDSAHWSAAQLADALGVSRRRLSAAFRRDTGMGLTDFIRTERLRIARRLLVQTSMPMQAIAERLGFSSSANFSTIFRQHVGMTPSQYRKKAAESDHLTMHSHVRWG